MKTTFFALLTLAFLPLVGHTQTLTDLGTTNVYGQTINLSSHTA